MSGSEKPLAAGQLHGPLYMGLDCSTQQLKAIIIDSALTVVSEARVDFDTALGAKYGVKHGTIYTPSDHSVKAPVTMWLEAVDLVLGQLASQGAPLQRVAGISGAGIQHSAVFLGGEANTRLSRLDPASNLAEQIRYDSADPAAGALSWPFSPNWQDGATQSQCDQFDAAFGSPETLAHVTGSKAHHRFTGPQILRFRENEPAAYAQTTRVCLVSSFLASVFLGALAPIDRADACGANLWDMASDSWSAELLSLASRGDPDGLRDKLGAVMGGNAQLGRVSHYFVRKYGFADSCVVLPFTGDNPATILSLPLRENDAIVSLGTSTTFLAVTSKRLAHPSYHMFHSPTTRGEYMFMLCYKNGGLARERVRDALRPAGNGWDDFNRIALSTPALGLSPNADTNKQNEDGPRQGRLGLYFPLSEIVPNVPPGTWRYYFSSRNTRTSTSDAQTGTSRSEAEQAADVLLTETQWSPELDVRTIIESQLLSIRLRSQAVLAADPERGTPPQPRAIYLVGGGSENPAIQRLVGEVLGGTEGVWKLNVGGAACALGAAHKALWAIESGEAMHGSERDRDRDLDFASLLGSRWNTASFAAKVDPGYRQDIWRLYGHALPALAAIEARALAAARDTP